MSKRRKPLPLNVPTIIAIGDTFVTDGENKYIAPRLVFDGQVFYQKVR